MKIRLDEIKIDERKRIRKEIGDISQLTRSISKHGLLQPIIIDRDYKLLAGFRRFVAVQRLGWSTIDAAIVDASDKLTRLEIEVDENLARKDFTFDEIDTAYEKLERLENPSVFTKIINFFKKLFK